MTEPHERISVASIMAGNATALSGAYLGLGLVLELLRRFNPSEGAMRASLAMDRMPAGVLRFLGLLEPLREAYFQNRLDALQLRVLFGLTAVAVIFALGFAVGALMWVGYWIRSRRVGPTSR